MRSFADYAYDAAGAIAFAAAAVASPLLYKRGLTRGLSQRLGRLPFEPARLPSPIWLHAASVGETLSAVPLSARIRRELAGVPLLTSSTTLTGQETALREIRPEAATLLPIDPFGIAGRTVARISPRALILVETEIWPGLIRAANERHVPVCLVSGTISERSYRRLRMAEPLVAATLQRLAVLCVQSEQDAERFRGLGAPPDRVVVAGSLKESRTAGHAEPGAQRQILRGVTDRPRLIAASTQPGEESIVLDACAGFWSEHPSLLLIIAPRRPERFDEVARLVDESGLRYQRRSAMGDEVFADTRVLLLDTLGELNRFFAGARAAFVGGTIVPLGGHNLLEPAASGVPVFFGPSVDNVADAARRITDANGGGVVHDANELGRQWWHLLGHADEAAAMGQRAASAASGTDALEKTWSVLAPILREAQ